MIYEYRVYCVRQGEQGPIGEVVKKFMKAVEKQNVKGLGPFSTLGGNEQEVSYILIWENWAHREKVWGSLGEDPDLLAILGPAAEHEAKDGPILFSQVGKFLLPM